MRKTPQQQRALQRVREIEDAALACLGEHGLDGVTTRRIADHAGISVGTLYHYYADKHEIVEALENRFVSELIRDLRQATPQIVREDIGSAVRSIAALYHTALTRDGGRWSTLVRHLMRRGLELTREIERPLTELAMQYLSHNPDFARIRDFPKVSYILLNACAFNLVRHTEYPPAHINDDALIDGLVAMAEAYVASQMPA